MDDQEAVITQVSTILENAGFKVVKRIRAHKNARDIPVIALTARAMQGDREKILGAGCDDYLAKPVEQKRILEKIRKWLK